MIVGNLRHKITLQRLSSSRHATSKEEIQAVAEEIAVWADFRASSAKEVLAAGREVSYRGGAYIIRWRSDVTGLDWQIKDASNRIWDIVGEPKELGWREGLEIPVELRI